MFDWLLGGKKNVIEGEKLPRLSPTISSSIMSVAGARGIPTMPAAAQKAFQLSTDPKAEARDFVEIIEADEGLSARVLKIANSVYFERGKKSETIEDSVMVIGINELRNLLSATTLTEIFPSKHPARPQLWSNDIATAIVAKVIARRVQPQKDELAFLGGLMHDIGKLLLLQRAGEEYSRVIEKVQKNGVDFCAAEGELFLFDHTEVGQLIGEKWNFSAELIEIIRNHHQPWSNSNGSTLARIVKAADTIAHAMGLGHPRGFSKLKNHAEESLDQVWPMLQIVDAERKGFLQQVQRSFDMEYDLYAGHDNRH